MLKVLFVCMGNICRSPTVEGVIRQQLQAAGLDKRIQVDSAGTHAYHVGEPPDARACKAALKRGYDISTLRARQVKDVDFLSFDLILAMDRENLALLRQACPSNLYHRVGLFLDYAPDLGTDEVPDPYYGDAEGFKTVLDLAEQGGRGLIEALKKRLPPD